ncbi:hypothetical protein [Corynebacterium meridianum]|uniref:Pentapeptide repeat-containing protein n=1 Tax=Corynebacterium meridianum TaxID=2765363 RepID=A0A934I1Z8_9CORY|nr:hypothetical protein [Corynebacterium meridianum]MBI8989785.1 hypothetical protein [Corynebacterium meridianum]
MTDSTPDGLNENAQKTLAKAWRTVVSLLTCRKPLLVTVIINVIFGAGVLLFALFIWKSFLGISGDKSCFTTPLLSGLCTSISPSTDKDILATLVSAVLPTVAGAAGIVYLTIAYRKRQQEERAEESGEIAKLEDKFINSVELLSRDTAMDHIAGLNSLASIADKRPELFNQRVVDTICSFIRASCLRVPAEEEMPQKEGEEIVQKEDTKIARKVIEISQTAAIGIIRNHTVKNENRDTGLKNSWSNCNFYLQQSEFFCPLHLKGCKFEAGFEVWGSTFHRAIYASNTHFKDLNINGCHFAGPRVIIDGAEFKTLEMNGEVLIDCDFYIEKACVTTSHVGTDKRFRSAAVKFNDSSRKYATPIFIHKKILTGDESAPERKISAYKIGNIVAAPVDPWNNDEAIWSPEPRHVEKDHYITFRTMPIPGIKSGTHPISPISIEKLE